MLRNSEAIELHSHHPLFARGQESVNKAMRAFSNKDGVFQQEELLDNLGRRWTVDMQPYNGLLGMYRYKQGTNAPAELALITGVNDHFYYQDTEQKIKLTGDEAVEKVEEILGFLIQSTLNIAIFDLSSKRV